jgi:hypothetical protein
MKLDDLAMVLRSKNAGAFYTTIDVFFDDPEKYHVAAHPAFLTVERVATAYGIPVEWVHGVFRLESALGIKVTIRKPLAAHDVANTDVMGAQQHLPLAWLEVPEEAVAAASS